MFNRCHRRIGFRVRGGFKNVKHHTVKSQFNIPFFLEFNYSLSDLGSGAPIFDISTSVFFVEFISFSTASCPRGRRS